MAAEIFCPHCGVQVNALEDGQDAAPVCPQCGTSLHQGPSPDDQAIEARAEAVETVRAEPVFDDEQPRGQQRAASGHVPPRNFHFQTRRNYGPGCCSFGCLGLIIFFFLALRGFFSLFS
jgi:hypothetical protein